MKVSTSQCTIERGGIRAENTFSIKTSAKAFEILSSQIYTDPIAAVVRELSCNAYDAHVAAGKKDEPFEIHLPNDLEPFFSVTDHGIGLSDIQIRGEQIPVMVTDESGELVQATDESGMPVFHFAGGLYTTYFDSTKTNSNDFIGALGLGSKSPFSYSSAFDVVSRFNGTKYIYSVFLNEDGVPSVALMGENPTTECNGLEVRIPVQPKDFAYFRERTSTILRFFPTKPKVVGVLHFTFKEMPQYLLKGDDWFVFQQENSNSYGNAITVIQGNVPYRVDHNKLTTLSRHEKVLLQHTSLALFFDIGELDVAASREEIRYDPRTIANIIAKLRKASMAVIEMVNEKAEKYKDCLWDAYVELGTLNSHVFTKNYINSIDYTLITSGVLRDYIDNNGTFSLVDHDSARKAKTIAISEYSRTRYSYGSSNKITRKDKVRVTPSKDVRVMFNDIRTRGISQVRAFVENNRNAEVILLTPIKDSDPAVNLIDLEILKKVMGNVKIEKVSEATEPIETNRRPVLKEPAYRFSGMREKGVYYRKTYSVKWERVSLQNLPVKPRLFFDIGHGASMVTNRVVGDGQSNVTVDWITEQDFKSIVERHLKIINHAYGTKYTTEDLFGVTKKMYEKLENDPNWKSFFHLLDDATLKYKTEIEDHLRLDITQDVFGLKQLIKDKSFMTFVSSLDQDSHFRSAVEKFKTTVDATYSGSTDKTMLEDLIQYSRRYRKEPVATKEKLKPLLTEKTFEQYPMLSLVKFANNYKILFDYIKLIDTTTGENP